MTPFAVGVGRAALALIIAASWLQGTPGEGLVDDPRNPTSPGDTAADTVPDADTLIHRHDTTIWHERGADRREILVTIKVPPGRDAVVVEPEGGDSALPGDALEFLEVNSVRVLTPSKLRHIEIRSEDAGQLNVTLLVRLPHCAHLDLAVREYASGRDAIGILEQDPLALPDCCYTVPTGAPDTGASAPGGRQPGRR